MGASSGPSDIETVTVQLAGLFLTISVSPLQSGTSPPESQSGYPASRVVRAVAGPSPTVELTPELRALVLETTSPLALAARPVPLLDLKAPLLRRRARFGRVFRCFPRRCDCQDQAGRCLIRFEFSIHPAAERFLHLSAALPMPSGFLDC